MIVVLLPRRQLATLLLCASTGPLVVGLELALSPFAEVLVDGVVGVGGLGAHGVVGGDVGTLVGRAEICFARVVEDLRGLFLVGHAEDAAHGSRVGGADGLAVPARALAVDLGVLVLVGAHGPLEGLGELVLVDLVVVVDELGRVCGRVEVVGAGAQLVGVPGQIDVEGGHAGLVGILAHERDEAPVLGDEAGHGLAAGRAVQPVDLDHFCRKDALAHDGAGEIEGKGGEVFPVAAHHFAHADSRLCKDASSPVPWHALDLANGRSVDHDSLNQVAHRLHGRWGLHAGPDQLGDLDNELLLDHAVRECARGIGNVAGNVGDEGRFAFGGLENGAGHGDIVDNERLGVSCKLGDREEFLVDGDGAAQTRPFEVTVTITVADQTGRIRARLGILFLATSGPWNLEGCLTGRTLEGLCHGVLDIVPVAPGFGHPVRLGLVADVVVEVGVDGCGDSVPWHASSPKVVQTTTQGVLQESPGIEHVRVPSVRGTVGHGQPESSSRRC